MRGLASHADTQREVAAVTFVLNSYIDASSARSKAQITDFAKLRKHLLRSVAAGAGADDGEEGRAASPEGKDAESRPGARSGSGSPSRHSHGHGQRAASAAGGGGGGDGRSTGERSEAATAAATLAALERLAQENDLLHARLIGIEAVLHEQVTPCSVTPSWP
jgi:hypothetical protein